MDFDIYTAGSAEFLEIMLNASAMITSSGQVEDLARVGALLGLLLAAFTAVFRNSPITFQQTGLVLVLYMMFYGPTATVVIEDTTTGDVRVVDNVALGPAFVGSILSTVSYGITKVSEQASSTPGMTNYGLFSSLNTLSRVRDSLRNPLSLDRFQKFGAASGVNLPKTLDEYLTYCALNPAALRNEQSIDDLYRAGSLNQVLSNASSSQFTFVYDGSAGFGVGAAKTCGESKTWLESALKAAYLDVLEDILNRGFSEQKASGQMTSNVQVEDRVTQAIQSFAISGKAAQEYVMSSLLIPHFGDARIKALDHWQEQRAAMALRESLSQQEVQWAGKGDTFKHYMRPMIAFFEGLVYALTPFMAFALLLGGPGLSLLGKYLVLPLAVGLWMPLLSIVNAFTLWLAGSEMEAILNSYDATGTGFAMLQVMDMDHAIGKALGIGGLLAASVPPLALFIVSGSAMVANSIMGQMTAGDKFKSEDVTPRSQQSSPVMATNSMYTSDQVGQGVSRTGSLELAENISGEQMATAATQSASQASQVATAQYQESLKAAGQQLNSTAQGRQALAGIGETMAAGSMLSTNSGYTNAKETLRGLGFTESSLNQATANAGLGISTPLGGLKRTDSTSADTMTQENRAKAEKALSQLTQSVQATDSKQLTFATGDAFTASGLAQQTATNTDEVAKNRSTALQAQQTYSTVASQQDTIKAGQSLKLRDAAVGALARGDKGRHESALDMERMAGETESGRQLYEKAYNSQSIKDMSTNDDERRAMASLRAMNQDGRLGQLLLSEYSPLDFNVKQGNAEENAGVRTAAAQATQGTENIAEKFESKWAGNESTYASEQDMSRSGFIATKESGAEAVRERNEQNLAPVMKDHAERNAEIDEKGSQAAYDSIKERGDAARLGTNLGREVANGANAVFQGIDVISNAFRSGSDSEKLDKYYDLGISNNLSPEEATYFAAKASGEFGESQGAAYQELSSYYRSQGIRDEGYIAGAITAIDDAAKAPDSGSTPTLQQLVASRPSVDRTARPSTSNEDVPQVSPQQQKRPSGITAD